MTEIYRDIFQAIHEGKWLYINYRNQSGELTKYWIAIKNFDVRNKKLSVEGLHLIHCTIMSEASIFLESIESTKVIEGSYYPRNEKLINDIYMNPHKYKAYFDNVANLKILTYLEIRTLLPMRYRLSWIISGTIRISLSG